jgi:signal transduction histidine kinase
MKKIAVVFVAVSMLWAGFAFAAEKGTPAEAEAMVKKAVAYIKANGKDKAFAEFSNPKGKFIDRDLYIFVNDLNGVSLAHGFNPKMIGKSLIDMKDADGKPYVRERIEMIKAKGKGWQDYKFTNPLTKRIENKTTYNERVDDYIVSCGAYK